MYTLALESLLRANKARRLLCSHSAQGNRNAVRAPVFDNNGRPSPFVH